MLGKFIWKFGKSFAKLLFDMPKSYHSHMMILLENHIHMCYLFLHWALSNCCDPWENSIRAFMIKIHVHTTYPLLCFYEKLALYHSSLPQNKCSTICVGLSLRLLLRKRDMCYRNFFLDTWKSKWKEEKRREKMHTRCLWAFLHIGNFGKRLGGY